MYIYILCMYVYTYIYIYIYICSYGERCTYGLTNGGPGRGPRTDSAWSPRFWGSTRCVSRHAAVACFWLHIYIYINQYVYIYIYIHILIYIYIYMQPETRNSSVARNTTSRTPKARRPRRIRAGTPPWPPIRKPICASLSIATYVYIYIYICIHIHT